MGNHVRPYWARCFSTSLPISNIAFSIIVFILIVVVVIHILKWNPIFLVLVIVLIPNRKPLGFLELVQTSQGHPLVYGNPPMPLWVKFILDWNPHSLLKDRY
jgi:hypothetical protein